MADDDKPKEPAASAARAGQEGDAHQPYKTAAELAGINPPGTAAPTLGLSQSPGLVEVPNSRVPGLAGGGMVSHVMGPGQAPVDPIAAGLDTRASIPTRDQLRVTTQTGVDGAGPGPSTYAEKPEGQQVKQRADNTHELVTPDSDAAKQADAVQSADKPATEAVPEGKGAPLLAKPDGEPKVQG